MPELTSRPDSERLEELLASYIERRARGEDVPSAEIMCRDTPALLEPLREGIHEYEQLRLLFGTPSDLAGRHLLHYRIVEKIGEGGMGQVFLAEDTRLGRSVALKLLPPGMATDPERFERFRREARLVASLSHPNIVTLFSLEEADEGPFLTMENVTGRTLNELIPPSGMDSSRILDISTQLLEALSGGPRTSDHSPGPETDECHGRRARPAQGARLRIGKTCLFPWPGNPGSGADTTLTRDGHLLGTLPYCSPEQLQGKPVDGRTDLFSFGVLLYEMIAGHRPFQGGSAAELISTILRDAPPAIAGSRSRRSRQLERVARRCLEKDPKDRFQSAAEVTAELRRIDAAAKPTRDVPRRSVWRWAVGGTVAILAALTIATARMGTTRVSGPGDVTRPAAQAPVSTRLAVAVGAFENLRNDPEIDWLSAGIAELLEIELLQEQAIDVVRPGDAERVVEGSFVRSGDALRIHFRLRTNAQEIVDGDRIQGRLETDLFAILDDLGRQVRLKLGLPERDLAAVPPAGLTSSVEAWRYFTESMRLEGESKNDAAVLLLEKAVSLDGDFALALVNLGQLHASLGHGALSRDYTRRALERADGIPIHLRYFIEGRFYGGVWRDVDRAIEAYRQGLAHDPDRLSLRSNLAILYGNLERFDEALEQYQAIFDRGIASQKSYISLALVYAALGRYETGLQILEDFSRREAGNYYSHFSLGWYLVYGGRLDEADMSLRRTEELVTGYPPIRETWWQLHILREDWEQALRVAREMAASTDSYVRWTGLVFQARTHLYRGELTQALARLEASARAYAEPETATAASHAWASDLLLRTGNPATALEHARRAREQAPGQWPELEGMAQAALGAPGPRSAGRGRSGRRPARHPADRRQRRRAAAAPPAGGATGSRSRPGRKSGHRAVVRRVAPAPSRHSLEPLHPAGPRAGLVRPGGGPPRSRPRARGRAMVGGGSRPAASSTSTDRSSTSVASSSWSNCTGRWESRRRPRTWRVAAAVSPPAHDHPATLDDPRPTLPRRQGGGPPLSPSGSGKGSGVFPSASSS